MKTMLNRPSGFAGDLAFQADVNETEDDTSLSLAWIRMQREAGRLVLGININCLLIGKNPAMLQPQVELVRVLAGGSIACLLVPQNFCDKTSDIYWAEKLRESLGPDGYALTWISEAKTSGWLMTLLRHVGGFVSGRMRAVILPAGVSTPALALTFESKFEGMYRLLGLHEKTFSSNRKPTSPIPNGYRK